MEDDHRLGLSCDIFEIICHGRDTIRGLYCDKHPHHHPL